ncbi:ShlB/FhaC/HecB family hemolysin secretion/activation protein [Providencia sp. wls1914]|uniref:ShlB/FhaC/HecB family hemolysin secretion/activation protein n=1 Tax=Providencia sp. wls1914 TaxID=2675156 RepID=UPI0012B6657F|nr:ShlB/FhaC/HecB family hemolysin secretion/activation protein [Providencia sp. wls1914]MTC72082.1 ShlB/FhaC/HecB family hemolysin secretion/activation protein [Providencia sp. wls1914]
MTNIRKIILLTFLFFINNEEGSAILPLPINTDSNQFEQRQRLEFEGIQRDSILNGNELQFHDNKLSDDLNAKCIDIKEIELINDSVIFPKEILEITNHYKEQCLSIVAIKNITKEITNYYIKQGYITSQAFISEQDLSNYILRIQVIEGRIESITIEDSPSRLVAMTFPNLTGSILNLRDIEQGLEQLNRSTSARYTIDIQPGTKSGYSRVVIQKQASTLPLNSQLSLDNSGNKSTGKQLLTGNLTADSLLGLGEQWSFNASTDTDFSRSHHSRYTVAAINVPYGYWSYRYQFYRNNTLQPFQASGQQYSYEGKNTNQQLDISRLIYRDGKQRLTLQGSLRHKNAKTQLAEQTLVISSPTLTSIMFSPQYTTMLGQGYFTLNPAAEWGISAFGASQDFLTKDSPRSHYRKFSLSSSYQYYFSNGLTYLTSFYGQYSPDNLYGVERVSIGGQYSVRGYHEQSLSGNRGGYWRNEMSKDIIDTSLGQLRVVGALDYGFIASDKYHVENGTLAGGAVGISLISNNRFYSQLLFSKPLHYPSQLKPDNWSTYWSVSLSL